MQPVRYLVLLSAFLLEPACSAEQADSSASATASGGSAAAGTTGGTSAGGSGGVVLTDAGLARDAGSGQRTNKVDLLFVIDNSMSMADKQAILAETVPDLVARMATPDCVVRNAEDEVVERYGPSTIDGQCPSGGQPEFRPVADIHIAVISSSLGGHGSPDACNPTADSYHPSQQDMAHLLTRSPSGEPVPTPGDLGFLVWDPEGRHGAAQNDLPALQSSFAEVVRGVGEQGCGFEAPLEAVYRFLIDPEPYQSLILDESHNPPLAVPDGVDAVLLQQRQSFLRPDSLLAIFTITDENDCSVRDEYTQYYWVALNTPMAKATSHCQDPNHPCCTSCAQPSYPAGCDEPGAPSSDINCQGGVFFEYGDDRDRFNVRCFDQKRRFGIDFLHPVQRYIDGIENLEVPNRSGQMVPNPIYSDLQCDGGQCAGPRDRSFIFWVGIVGVPWQDVAVDPNDLGAGLMSGRQLADEGRWNVILGDPASGVPPSDPHMVESITPRTGINPITGDALLPPDTAAWNPINGHERSITDGSDLQYACIFPLPTPRVCADGQQNCDCRPEADPAGTSNPLCQAGPGTPAGTEQHHAKAYPSSRVLAVLAGLDPEQVVVSSICPAQMSDDQAPDFGYRPVVPPLLDRIVRVLIPE